MEKNRGKTPGAAQNPAVKSTWRKWSPTSTTEMINDCFRHQHPEAYGRDQVPQGAVPWNLQCGHDHLTTSPVATVPEEPTGNPHARPLDNPVANPGTPSSSSGPTGSEDSFIGQDDIE